MNPFTLKNKLLWRLMPILSCFTWPMDKHFIITGMGKSLRCVTRRFPIKEETEVERVKKPFFNSLKEFPDKVSDPHDYNIIRVVIPPSPQSYNT